MTRYIPVSVPGVADTQYAWDLFDTETRQLARWGDRRAYLTQWADQLDAGTRERSELAWTDWQSLRPEERSACEVHLRPQASPEFWAEAQLAAEAAGYCEVFDRIAALLGGPVREGRDAATRDYVTITARVNVPRGTQVGALTGAVAAGLNEIEGLRFSAHTQATVTENPDIMALRARVEELRAQRAQTAPDGLADWERALLTETAE